MNRQERKQVVETAKYYHFDVETTDTVADYETGEIRGSAQATVCIGQFGEKFVAGISLCCPEDQFSRSFGRREAMKRAINPQSVFRRETSANNIEVAKEAVAFLMKDIEHNILPVDKALGVECWFIENPTISPRGGNRKKKNG